MMLLSLVMILVFCLVVGFLMAEFIVHFCSRTVSESIRHLYQTFL